MMGVFKIKSNFSSVRLLGEEILMAENDNHKNMFQRTNRRKAETRSACFTESLLYSFSHLFL